MGTERENASKKGGGGSGTGSPLDRQLRGGLKVQRDEVTYADHSRNHSMELGPGVISAKRMGFTHRIRHKEACAQSPALLLTSIGNNPYRKYSKERHL